MMEFAAVHRAHPGHARRADEPCAPSMNEHQDVILKPLDGMGGMGIYRVKADGA
jgi:glutathione synthase/RimK-type ligase-like ATP-grasp enzyme